MIRFLLILGGFFCASTISGQTFYYVHNGSVSGNVNPNPHLSNWYLNCFNTNTCQDSSLTQIDTSGIGYPMLVSDLAVCPNGKYYVTLQNTSSGSMLAELNPGTGALLPFDTMPSVFPPYILTALVCGENNVLYAGGAGTLYKYDLENSIGEHIGYLPTQTISDLTFRDGFLYGSTFSQYFQVSLDPLSSVIINSPPPWLIGPTCFASERVSCDSTATYVTVRDLAALPNQVHLLNPLSLEMVLKCDLPFFAWGIACNEFKPLDCSVSVNLDPLGQSGAPPTDWQSGPLCTTGQLPISSSEATYYSGHRTDSMRIRLLPPIVDATFEYLTATASGIVTVIGQATQQLMLSATSSAVLDDANSDFQSVLRSAKWHNDAPLPSPGLRMIEVIAFASGGRSDTSFAFIPVPVVQFAGRDTVIGACADVPALSLLPQGGAVGGAWSPFLPDGVFHPPFDLPGIFVYTIDNGSCPSDTAYVMVEIWPLPVFSLGEDAKLCDSAFPIVLETVGTSVWQDGTMGQNLVVSAPGLYWAEYTNNNGCVFRDSITIETALADTTFLNITACQGDMYVLGSDTIRTPGTHVYAFANSIGCDSILSLTFHLSALPEPILQGDTVYCAGGFVTLSPGAFDFYQWSTGAHTPDLEVNGLGTYTVTVTGTNGCTNTASINVHEAISFVADVVLGDPVCPGDSNGYVQLSNPSGGFGAVTFSINSGTMTDWPLFEGLYAGSWVITAVDALGCTVDFHVNLEDPPPIILSMGTIPELTHGSSYQIPLEVSSPGVFDFSWEPSAGLDCNTCQQPFAVANEDVLYKVAVKDSQGCEASDSIWVRVKKGEGVYIPNIFSPNGDGRNERLTIYGNPAQTASVLLFQVFDRWGEMLFDSNSLNINDESMGWDGTSRGRPVLPGVYVWRVRIRLANGELLEKVGEVTVVR